jgi:hypothetical protein
MNPETLKFMGEHPWLTIALCLIAGSTITSVLFRLPNRIIRHLNIRKAGWPPAHLDADGDLTSKE